ncbi:hypothetical protein GQ457_01G007510 [Hibiscus cannabinus]
MASVGTAMKSFNIVILKFPKIDESLRKCKAVFQQFDEEITDLFDACDINQDMGIKFNEFIVLLCFVHLLKDNANGHEYKSRMGLPNLEATFETFVDAFVFLDKNKDGFVSKNEMAQAINEFGQRLSGKIAMRRFEFLFAFTNWVGIDDEDDD